jgi:hypothetical protein
MINPSNVNIFDLDFDRLDETLFLDNVRIFERIERIYASSKVSKQSPTFAEEGKLMRFY